MGVSVTKSSSHVFLDEGLLYLSDLLATESFISEAALSETGLHDNVS
jgi:hypothetical protein